MVLPDITNPFFPEIIRGAEDAAFGRGYVTALFVCNGLMTLGALQPFHRNGISILQDYALATFDEVSADHSAPLQLTTVVQPSYGMEFRAGNMLMDRIEGRLTRAQLVIRVEPRLELRHSTSRRVAVSRRQGSRA